MANAPDRYGERVKVGAERKGSKEARRRDEIAWISAVAVFFFDSFSLSPPSDLSPRRLPPIPLPSTKPKHDSYEKFVVPEGVKRVAHARDTRVEHAATLTIQREDHTVGNLLRCALLRDREVTFAGYKIPHPLEYRMLVKVQTRGRRSSKQVSARALEALADEAAEARRAFEGEVARVRGGGGGGGGDFGAGGGGGGGGGDYGY